MKKNKKKKNIDYYYWLDSDSAGFSLNKYARWSFAIEVQKGHQHHQDFIFD